MKENIDLASSIYRTTSRTVAIDPAVRLDASGNPKRQAASQPTDLDDWFLNSAIGLVCCCYMEALGKIIVHGKGGYKLNIFAEQHMPDLIAESENKGSKFAVLTLYKIYRNGFVHQFAGSEMVWSRCGRSSDYWFSTPDGRAGINIDRLAEGVVRAIDHFEAWFRSQVAAGAATYSNFFDWLDSD
jgi:hypothetical protein